MVGINSIITGILASKIDNKKSQTPTKSNCLQKDIFQRTTARTSYLNNSNGVPTLKLVRSVNREEIERLDGTKIYTSERTFEGEKETIYEKNGIKLYDIEIKKSGAKTKTIYHNDGNTIKSIIQYDKDGNVICKKVVNPSRTRALTEEEEKRIPKYLYHLTSTSNYESMANDGLIRTTRDKMLDKEGNRAVFLVDGENCINQWANISNGGETSYITKLLKFCDKDRTGNVLLLRIETDKLDKSKLRLRDQNEVMRSFAIFDQPDKEQDEYFAFEDIYEKLHPDRKMVSSEIANDIFLNDLTKRLSSGVPIYHLEEMEDTPHEVIYGEEVPFEAIKDIKLIDTSILTTMSYYDSEAEKIAIELLKKAIEK